MRSVMRPAIWVMLSACSFLLWAGGCARTPPPAPKMASATPPPPPPPEAPPPPAPEPPPAPAEPSSISIFYDFDSYVLPVDAGPSLQKIAARAKQSGQPIKIEGHCDERGTPEYNLALGEGRARSAQEYLERLGVPKTKLNAVSFGSQRPKATGHDEASWSQNRRSDVTVE